MADPKKNPLIGAFRTPAPGSTPVTSTEGEPKTAPPVQDTPPKAAEPPKDAVPKVKADATAHTTPGDVKKSQEPSDPEKPSTGEVAKSIDEKKGAEASKTPTEEKEPSDQDGDKSKGKSIDIVSQVPVDEIIAKSLFKIDEKDPSFKELVEDIRKNGMKVPINVNRTADGKYEVIDGNRRLAAAKKLGMKTINATIMNLPDRLLRKGQFHSNLAPRLILEVPGEGGDKSPQLSDSAKPTKVKKPEELPKATDLKGKAEGAATAGPTEAKQSKEQPTDSAALRKGVGHFKNTSLWDGNCCLAAHNRGTRDDFKDLHTLEPGDTITWTTKLGTRTYEVISVTKVRETDTSGTAATSDNRLTLYTCVRDQRDYRWMVQAIER